MGLIADERHTPLPTWLSADFLYRINYGPATEEDATHACKAITAPGVLRKSKRVELTLLDRCLVDKLFQAIFRKGSPPPVLYSDWNETKEPKEGTKFWSGDMTSPFDYVSHSVDTAVYRWCEEFVIHYVWRHDYSSGIFGRETRPPMAAVVSDIILLAQYLAALPRYPERPLVRCFSKFLVRHKRSLRSMSVGLDFDFNWAARGYLWDLYNIIVLYRVTENGLDKYNPKLRSDTLDEAQFINVTWIENARFPGGDTLGMDRLADPDHVKTIFGSLADMRASYINSGPFKLALTTNLSEHLTMKDRKIMLYCDKPSKARQDRGHIPAAGYYGPYTRHKLGRLDPHGHL